MKNRVVFHVDVNSAYLSWEAVYRLQHGDKLDLREVPSIIGGDPEKRRGIVLAKSLSAKKAGIKTGEVLFKAFQKCPNLQAVRPNYSLYIKSSRALVDLLKEYSPDVQRFSIDECFVEFTDVTKLWGDPVTVANTIRERVKKELGFTVNIGISSNKLLAKVASEFEKPNKVHTLFPEEMKGKMWPLPVGDLFGVGRATEPKLKSMGILTVGDLAQTDPDVLKYKFGKFGGVLWNYANGIEDSLTRESGVESVKGIGNSSTLPRDIETKASAYLYLLSLTEMVAMRLRDTGKLCGLVSVSVRSSELDRASHQRRLFYNTDSTMEIFKEAKSLFDELWDGRPIRHLGVRVSKLVQGHEKQLPLIDAQKNEKQERLDKTIDELRLKYGTRSILRSSFLHTGVKPVMGGVGEEDYPMMRFDL
ncbi:DNA polymerase thumb domain-containing protein [Fusibacter sp. JL216-2]|uniref:Y-family DNA polymerase n=1 Tax=Fusibacter sp. JL216-2 TaxID=3071453 RepID=UPI003D358663